MAFKMKGFSPFSKKKKKKKSSYKKIVANEGNQKATPENMMSQTYS
tara:strand:+ start:276 stop:413 length:138 start_codon:yes stop_codon:yes gene_type:complete